MRKLEQPSYQILERRWSPIGLKMGLLCRTGFILRLVVSSRPSCNDWKVII